MPTQALPAGRLCAGRTDGDMICTRAMDDEPLSRSDCAQPLQHIRPVGNPPGGDVVQQDRRQTLPQVRPHVIAVTLRRRALLETPVRHLDEALARGVARIGPAEAPVEQILDRLPCRAACRPGRIGIEAADRAIGSHDPSRHQQVHLQPPHMGVRRCQEGRTAGCGNARERHLDPEAQREVNRAAQARIAGVERGRVDILGSKREHSGVVFPAARRGADCRAHEAGISHEKLRHGIAPDDLP